MSREIPPQGSEASDEGAAPVQEPGSLQDSPLPPPPAERVPFWGYSDVFLVAALAFPCMIAGWAAVRLVMMWHAPSPAQEAIPAMMIGYGLIFGVLRLIFLLQYGRPFWRSLGWTRTGIPFFWNISLGLATALCVGMVGRLIRVPPTTGPIVEMMQSRQALILVAIFGTTIGPLCEELAFRGFLQPLVVRSAGAAGGIGITAALFGFLHFWEYGAEWRNALEIAIAGAAFGYVRHRSGSTRAATIMHAAFNGLSFVALFWQGVPAPAPKQSWMCAPAERGLKPAAISARLKPCTTTEQDCASRSW
jgi:membrane protease YdiL (CAAX protease family)